MKRSIIGEREFGSVIDITDPCYEKDVWCRKNGVSLVPGIYECWADIASNEETDGWGPRVARLGMTLKGHLEDDEAAEMPIDCIGVDSGLAGFFDHDTEYTREGWETIANMSLNGHYWIVPEGVFSTTGVGDGSYQVYGHLKDGTEAFDSLEIEFLWFEEDHPEKGGKADE